MESLFGFRLVEGWNGVLSSPIGGLGLPKASVSTFQEGGHCMLEVHITKWRHLSGALPPATSHVNFRAVGKSGPLNTEGVP